MRTHLVAATLMLIASTLAAPAAAQTTLTFEGLPNALIPAGYGGFTWTNYRALNTTDHVVAGYRNGTISGTNVAFNQFGGNASFQSETPFTLNSAWFTAAFTEGQPLTVNGFIGATIVYTTALILNTQTPLHAIFNWEGLTQVQIVTTPIGGNRQYAMDDLVVNGPTSVVPEPISVLLLATGLAGVAAMRRRRAVRA